MHRHIFFYKANLIGYFRVFTLLLSFGFHATHPILFLFLYGVSFLLDMVDGHVARLNEQTSRFGAALDIFTDKLSSPGLMLILRGIYPEYSSYFVAVLLLDIASHYFHFYNTLLSGNVSHKVIDPSKKKHIYWFLYWFYTYRPFFGYCCLGFEAFLYLLYVHSLFSNSFLVTVSYVLFPSFVCKNLVHVAQLMSAVDDIVKWDHAHKTHKEYPIADPILCFGI